MKTYAEAIQTPKQGWSHADHEQTVAAAAKTFGDKLCINPKRVYGWIFESYGGDWQTAGKEIAKESPLICTGAILDGYRVSDYT